MPDVFDANGLKVKTLLEIRDEITTAFQQIYGPDTNIDQDSPDGQLVNIFAQSATDIREALAEAVSSFDPDQAEGRVLDQRVALNGITRKGATYTMLNIDLTVDRAVNLQGLDSNLYDINGAGYTVKDGVGNLFILAESRSFPTAGTYTVLFRAKEIGRVIALPNTITIPDTIVAGVTAINNPHAVISQGVNEESDAELKLRRYISMGIGSIGMVASVRAALFSIKDITDCYVTENNTGNTNAYGVPGHSIWAIVEGGLPDDIGEVLYAKRGAGCGTYGEQSITVTPPDQDPITLYFDRPDYVPLYIKFDCGFLGGGSINIDDLKTYITQNLVYKLKQISTADEIINIVSKYNSSYYVENCLISKDGSDWKQLINPDNPQQKFTISFSNIDITQI
jgi:uncharacterized phage protein gp47/JayE